VRKEVEFKAKFDTSDFDKSVESMQKKLREIYQPSDMARMQGATAQRLDNLGFGGTMSRPGSDAFQRSSHQARRELEASITREAQGQEKLAKFINERVGKLDQLKKLQAEAVKGSEEELRIKEKIARVEANLYSQREGYKQRDAVLNQMLNTKQKGDLDVRNLVDAYKTGGMGGLMGQGGNFLRAMGPAGMIGAAGGAISTLGVGLGMAGDSYRAYGRMPIQTAAAMGSATQGFMGQDVQNIYGRRSAFESFWTQERARSASRALEAMNSGMTADKMGLAGNMLKWGGAGMASGAGIGAGLGTALFPGVGTAAGAGIFGALGGAGGAITGLLRADPRERALGLSQLPFIGGRYKQQYESMVAQQVAGDYQGGIESEKNMNPYKKAASADYEQNFMRNLQFQRSLGFNNDQMYGSNGFMRGAIGNGFTPEMAMEMSGNILGAGGSTRMARDSGFGLQLQRGMDLTNAGQVLGTLSGSIGGSESTKQATIKLLAEGMKLGLDDSKFAEENRKFTQAAAEAIAKSGTSNQDDFERIAAKFGSFMNENTSKGIESARGAYQEYQKMSSETTGPRGVMRAAGFMSDPDLNKLSTIEKQSLMQIPEDQLNEDNFLVQGAAKSAGISPKELVGKISGLNQKSMSRFKDYDERVNRLKAAQAKAGKKITKDNLHEFSDDVQKDYYMVGSYQNVERGYGDVQTAESRMSGAIGDIPGQADTQRDREAVVTKKTQGSSGRMEDNTIAAMAGDAGTVLKNFNEMRGGMDAAAKSAAAFTDQIREMNAMLLKALEDAKSGNGNYLDSVKKVMQQYSTPVTQQQAGRTSK
jgi:hypothetical protein